MLYFISLINQLMDTDIHLADLSTHEHHAYYVTVRELTSLKDVLLSASWFVC